MRATRKRTAAVAVATPEPDTPPVREPVFCRVCRSPRWVRCKTVNIDIDTENRTAFEPNNSQVFFRCAVCGRKATRLEETKLRADSFWAPPPATVPAD